MKLTPLKKSSNIENWEDLYALFTKNEIEALSKFAEGMKYLEIGVNQGFSLITMSKICPLAIGIEINPESHKISQKHLNDRNLNGVVLRGASSYYKDSFADHEFGIVFIDGNHNYEGVKEDFENFKNKGDYIALHDFHPYYTGICKLIEEIDEKEWTLVLHCESLVILRRKLNG